MPIDVNEPVRVWGGFSPGEFWAGSAALVASAAVALVVGTRVAPDAGAAVFIVLGGGTAAFMVYRQGLPPGTLLRRLRREGRFLVLRVPGFGSPDVYPPLAAGRADRFRAAFEEDRAAR